MMIDRTWQRLSAILVLAFGLSCTPSGPSEPSAPTSDTPGQVTIAPGILLTPTLLSCSPQRYLVTTKQAGPNGAKIKVGGHVLTIPAGALSEDVTIVAEQLTGSVNSVRLSPEGLQFAKPARLTLEYRNCRSTRQEKRVAYTDELLRILDLPPSEDYPNYDYVTAKIDHFSRYAVAY